MIKNYFNIEGLAERLRTCRQEDKRELWNDMKTLGKIGNVIQVFNNFIFSFRSSFNKYLSQLYNFNIEQGGDGYCC